ncbi:caspase domain-containing protein [Bacteroidota bacterium]
MKKLIIIYMLWVGLIFPSIAQTFEAHSNLVKISMKPEEDMAMREELSKSGKYYALLIGVQNYDDPEINDLGFPLEDVNDMENILSSYYTFEKENIETLRDPTREQMIIALDKLNKKLTEKDNLLIFYAGHGYYREDSKQGFWLPSNAQKENSSKWFRNTTLVDYIRAIPSRHTLLISDACFSGSIFRTRQAFNNVSMAYYTMLKTPSRKAMTSGALQKVPDESVFLRYLKKKLLENENKYTSSEEFFASFKIAVMNNTSTIPRFGEIQNAGDEGGDFIFIRKD